MNPDATLRMRRTTALLAVGWALLSLALGFAGQVTAASQPEPPFTHTLAGTRAVIHSVTSAAADAGIEPGDRLLAIDGRPLDQWLRAGRPLVVGRPNAYTVQTRGGRRVEAVLEPIAPGSDAFALERLLRLAIPAVGAIYLGIGLLVWRLKADRAETWAFLLFCCAMASELFLSPEFPGPTPLGWFVHRANVPLIGATAFHLFTTHPLPPPWIVRRPQIRGLVYAASLALSVLIVLEGVLAGRSGPALRAGFLLSLTFALAGLGGLALEWRRNRDDPAGQRTGIVLLGALASFLPLCAALLVHFALGTFFPWPLALLGLFLFPAAVGWGIARNQLFDIRGAARSSAVHGAATLVITGLFAFCITSADALFTRLNVNARSPLFSVVFLFFAVLIFNPVRSRVQQLVDGFFDRDRAAYRRAVREISEAMVSMLSVKEVVDRILVAATDTMGLEGAAVLLLDEREGVFSVASSRGDFDEEARGTAIASDHPLCKQLWMRREELSRQDFDAEENPEVREACRDVYDALGAELLVPIVFGVDLLGVIAVGRKLSAERLGADDRQLLRTLANQSAIAIENAKAFDEIAKLNETLELRVEERTHELREAQAQLLQSEKMRSLGQLVAGVAHELNNPIGFVHANLQLIADYAERLESGQLVGAERERAREALRKLLDRSREGTSRVKQIVEDLRTFSRTDRGELQEVDVNAEIDRTLGLMAPRLGHEIRVERDYGELPRIRCFAGPLNQVFLNLLVNACDALEGKGSITIRTRATPDGVRVEFRDDGPGIPLELQSRIFEPFFTTKAVGRGTGLGLSLSHGIVQRHGGRLTLDSTPGEGSTFAVELPREARPPQAAAEKGGAA